MRITVNENHGVVEGPFRAADFEILRTLPGRKRWKERVLYFENTAGNVDFLKTTFPQAEWVDTDRLRQLAELRMVEEDAIAQKQEELQIQRPEGYTFKTEPFQHQLKALHFSKGKKAFGYFMDMGCVDCNTEYLSPTGWRKISKYDGGMVMQYNLDTHEADFVQPLEYVVRPADLGFYHFTNTRGLDQMLSPDHNMVVERYNGKLSKIPAKELVEKFRNGHHKVRIPAFCHYKGGEGLNLSEVDLRLQVAVIADGHFPSGVGTDRVYVRLKKKRKIDRLKSLLCASDREYRESKQGEYLVYSFEAPIKTKHFDERFWKASYQQRRIIAQECVHWDGSARKSEAKEFSSTSRESAEFIQFCFFSTGKRASLRVDTREGRTPEFTVHAVGEGRTTSYLNLNQYTKIEEVPSDDGLQYCFEVPWGCLVLRRSGKVFVTGNTGKSKTTVDDIGRLYTSGEIELVLVLAPNGVHRQWIREQIPEHLPDNIPRKTWFWNAAKKADPEIMQRCAELRVFAMNIESLSTPRGCEFAEQYLQTGKAMIVVDESSRIKNPSAKRTKSIIKLRKYAEYRRILSGAPITKGIEDLYSQFLFLDEDILGFRSFYTFRNRYCITQQIPGAPSGAVKIVGYRNVEELQRRVEGHTFRVTKDECLDLPPKIYTTREVDLTPEQRKLYVELRDDFYTLLNDGTIVDGALAVTRLMRLQQVLCGFLPIPEDAGGGIREVPSNRLGVALELVDEAPGKVLIWARFHYDIDAISGQLRKQNVAFYKYDGRMSADERTAAIDDFRKNPAIKVLIAQPQAGGIGLNLAVADTVIYYSNDFNADTRWQSEDRTHRIGQDKPVTYIDLVSPGTVDVKIRNALRQKKNVADLVLDPSFIRDDKE